MKWPLRPHVLAALSFCLLVGALLALPATASAATSTGPAAFSAVTPEDGSSVYVARPLLSVAAYDAKGLMSSPYVSLKLDGHSQTPSITFAKAGTTVDATHATVAFTPRADLTPGTHTVWVAVMNGGYAYSTYTYSFTYSVGPHLSQPAPDPAAECTTTSPVVSAKVSGVTTGIVTHVKVDGIEFPSSFDGVSGLVSATAVGLSNDETHTAVVSVTNAAGGTDTLSFSFGVEIYPLMPVATDCATCHQGYPMSHPMTQCAGCHGPDSPVGEGWSEPAYAEHSPAYLLSLDCTDCHGSRYASIPPLHQMSPATSYHDTTTSCAPCHVRSITTEHARYGLTCATCHTSADPAVSGAIAAGQTACSACHADADHAAVHTVAVPASCTGTGTGTGCHSGTSLTAIHINSGTTLTCDTCHASSDSSVTSAIANHDTDCTACHGASGHISLHDTTVPQDCGSSSCHAATNLTQLHPTCDTCHASTATSVTYAISKGLKDCTVCHNTGVHLDVAQHAVTNTGCGGSGCHTENVSAVHPSCLLCHGDGAVPSNVCSACHVGMDPDTTAPTSTSDAKVSYVGTATVTMSAVDAQSGVRLVYYRLDGGPRTVGNVASVAPPATGSQDHTLVFWAMDVANNQEAPHSVTFSVFPPSYDVVPPAGTMSIDQGASSASSTVASVDSLVTDAGTGVSVMRVDPGNGVLGPWIPYAASLDVTLTAGDGMKTVRAQYRDGAGNVTSLSDSILLDTTAPSTTSDAAASYTGYATIALSATDAGTGVRTTYYRLDSGAQTAGKSLTVSTPGDHTLTFWSVDDIGNAEAPKSVNFTVVAAPADVTAPVTTSNAAPSYTGTAVVTLSASDTGGSGLRSTYYELDGSAQRTGTSVTVPAPISGTASHTLTFWSDDYAGNTETAKSVTFTVSAPPPGSLAFSIYNAPNAEPAWTETYSVIVKSAAGTTVTSASGTFPVYWASTPPPLATIQVPAGGPYTVDMTVYDTGSGPGTEVIEWTGVSVTSGGTTTVSGTINDYFYW